MNTLTIARFTLREALRRRVVLAGVVLSLTFIGLFAIGFTFLYGAGRPTDLGSPDPLALAALGSALTLLGLYAVHFMSSFLALFLSVGSVSTEIDSGTLHAVLARPLRRAEFILGRWLAYAGLLSVYVGLMAALTLVVARQVAGYEAPSAPRAIGLMMLGAVLLMTISLLGSTRLPTLANGVVVFSLFGLAWLAGVIELIGSAVPNQEMVNLGIVLSLLVPSDATWRAASYFAQTPLVTAVATGPARALPFAASGPPTTALIVWALLYPLAGLGAAVYSFSRRDL